MKIEDRDRRMRFLNLLRAVTDVERDQTLGGQTLFRVKDYVNDALLPIHRNVGRVRFVANFVEDVVEVLQLGDYFADEPFLNFEQAAVFIECVNVEPPDIAKAVDVVVCVERAELPLGVAVERAEEIDLNDNTAVAR